MEGELDLALVNKAKSLGIKLEELTEQQKADAINMHFRNTTGTLSTSAKNLNKRNYKAVVCNGIDETLEKINNYLNEN